MFSIISNILNIDEFITSVKAIPVLELAGRSYPVKNCTIGTDGKIIKIIFLLLDDLNNPFELCINKFI